MLLLLLLCLLACCSCCWPQQTLPSPLLCSVPCCSDWIGLQHRNRSWRRVSLIRASMELGLKSHTQGPSRLHVTTRNSPLFGHLHNSETDQASRLADQGSSHPGIVSIDHQETNEKCRCVEPESGDLDASVTGRISSETNAMPALCARSCFAFLPWPVAHSRSHGTLRILCCTAMDEAHATLLDLRVLVPSPCLRGGLVPANCIDASFFTNQTPDEGRGV